MVSVVCLSVCRLSETFVFPTQRVKIFGNIFTRFRTLGIWGGPCKISQRSAQGNPSNEGVECKGYDNWHFSTNISLYFQNGTRYGHSNNGRRKGTRMQLIEWCHFQWLWVTPNLDFKVTILLTANNSKMVHDRPIAIVTMAVIESRIWSVEGRHFQWPWMTLNQDFKGTPFFDV